MPRQRRNASLRGTYGGTAVTDSERPTTASIDGRVARLEAAQAATDRKVDSLAEKLSYMDDLIKLKFSTVEASIGAQSAKLDSFMARIDKLIEEGLRTAGDLDSTPVGRSVNKRLSEVERITDDHQARIDEQRGAVRLGQFLAGAAATLASIAAAISVLHITL